MSIAHTQLCNANKLLFCKLTFHTTSHLLLLTLTEGYRTKESYLNSNLYCSRLRLSFIRTLCFGTLNGSTTRTLTTGIESYWQINKLEICIWNHLQHCLFCVLDTRFFLRLSFFNPFRWSKKSHAFVVMSFLIDCVINLVSINNLPSPQPSPPLHNMSSRPKFGCRCTICGPTRDRLTQMLNISAVPEAAASSLTHIFFLFSRKKKICHKKKAELLCFYLLVTRIYIYIYSYFYAIIYLHFITIT